MKTQARLLTFLTPLATCLLAIPDRATAETIFAQDFEAGLSPIESTHGAFSINNAHAALNNGTMMMGHSAAYGPLGGGATPLPSYSYYEIELDLRGWVFVTLTFDMTAGIENAFDGVNLVASTDGPVDPPNGLITPTAASDLQYGALTFHGASSPELGATAWSSPAGSDVTSVSANFDLSAFDDQKVILRFQFGTDAFEGGDGANIDNILIDGTALPDFDSDGMHDGYEDAHGLDAFVDDRTLDLDGDGVLNFDEYLNCTHPNDTDTDDDGLSDKIETNTGTYVDAEDTGTDPTNPDTDGDTLADGVEDNSLEFNGLADPGTNPLLADTDGDKFTDRQEIDLGFDPTDPNSTPPVPIVTEIGGLLGNDLTDPDENIIDSEPDDGFPLGQNADWVSVTASSELSFSNDGDTGDGGHEAALDIFDNKVGGGEAKWCCNGPPQDVTVEFEDPVSLTHFTITSGNDTPARDPLDWQILGSDDGVAFTPLYTRQDNTPLWPVAPRNVTLRIDLPAGAPFYKFIRYEVTRTGGANHQINEIEYFGTVNQEPFVIKAISFDEDTNMFTLTWSSRPNRQYTVQYNDDLTDWESDAGDSFASQGEETTHSFPHPEADAPRLFFRVFENP